MKTVCASIGRKSSSFGFFLINITNRNAQIASVFLEPAHNCGVLLLALGDCQRRKGDDRVSDKHADRHENIYHNGSSGFGGNADSAETADLRPCTH